MKHIFIFKIGEDLSLNTDDKSLKTGEPMKFAEDLVHKSTTNNRVYLFDSTCTTRTHSKATVRNFNTDINVLANVLAPLDEIVLILWQGMRGDNRQKMTQTYLAYNHVVSQLEFHRVTNLVREYFVQTDLRIPLFDFSVQFPLAKLNTKRMTLLSQATVDYRDDLKEIFETQTRPLIKEWCGEDIYTEFRAFEHLELYLLAYKQKGALPYELRKTEVSFVSQGYDTMLGFRRKIFRQYFCNGFNIDTEVFGRFNITDQNSLLQELTFGNEGNSLDKTVKMQGIVPWTELSKSLQRSKFSLCVNNPEYDKYGLIPNRVLEAMSVEALPILINCNAAKTLFNEYYAALNATSSDPKMVIDYFNGLSRQMVEDITQDFFTNIKVLQDGYIEKINKI